MVKRISLIVVGLLLWCCCFAEGNGKATVRHLTKAEFLKKVWNYEQSPQQWKYLGDKPCMIDFYTTWCGPCKRLAPILEELAAEYGDKLIIYKVNTEVERELAGLYRISSIPTLLFIPMEGQPQMAKGLLPKETLEQAFREVLLVTK